MNMKGSILLIAACVLSIASAAPVQTDNRVSECHDAAKAFCTNGHNFCRACQAYGTWGSMFFVAVCNDNPKVCHQNITTVSGAVCTCQRPGGCAADGDVCLPATSTPPPPLLLPPPFPPSLPPAFLFL